MAGASLAAGDDIDFGGVTVGACAERTVRLRNEGTGLVAVTAVRLRHCSRHWKLGIPPLPVRLPPGACLEVTLRYKATEQYPHDQALVVDSDDPVAPVREIAIKACTAWTDDGPWPGKDRPVAGAPAAGEAPHRN